MAVRDWFERRREKKRIEDSKKYGSIYLKPEENKNTYGVGVSVPSDSGQRDTSGNIVKSPTYSSPTTNPTITRSGRSGSSSSSRTPSPTPKPKPTSSNLRETGSSSGGGSSTSPRNKTPTTQNLLSRDKLPEEIVIQRSGAVRQGNRTYTGNAFVGDTGKTANQIQKELRDQYKKETGEAVGQGRLSGTITYKEVFVKDEPGESIFFKPKEKKEFDIKDYMTPTSERKEYPGMNINFTTQPSKYENFSIWTAPLYLGEKLASTKPGVKVEEFLQEKFKKNEKAIKGTQFIEGVTRDLPKWAFFSPAMATGTAGRIVLTESEKKALSQGKFSRLEEALKKLEKEIAKKKKGKEQTDYLIKQFRKLKTPEQKENFRKWVKELYDKNIYKGVPLEMIKPQKGIIATGGQASNQNEIAINFIKRSIVPMKRVDILGAGSSSLKLEEGKIQDNSLGTNMFSEIPKEKVQGKYIIDSILSSKPQSRTKNKPKSKVMELLKEGNVEKTIQKINQQFKQQQGQTQRQALLLRPTQLLKQQTRQVQRPTPRTPIKPIPSFNLKNIANKIKEEGFEVFGKRFGEDVFLFKTKDKLKAEKSLKNFLTGTLGRSGKILKNGEELSFDELGLFKTGQFRPAKKDKTRVVQKAKFSLGTGSEVSEIQYFKNKSSGKTKSKKRNDWFS